MPKYYYTCPIKAAYMAKEFGVQFEQWLYPTIHSVKEELCKVSFLEIVREIEFSQQDTNEGKFRNRYIVAPESENIFELKERDLCKNIEDDDMGELSMIQGHGLAIPVADGNEGGWMVVDRSEVEILKRDNKQFFMPEVEND